MSQLKARYIKDDKNGIGTFAAAGKFTVGEDMTQDIN